MVNKQRAAKPPANHLFTRQLIRSLRCWLIVGLVAGMAVSQVPSTLAQDLETPELTSTARPTATPTPSPADLALAGSFARLGKLDEARGAYAAVIERGSSTERLVARYSLAKLLLDEGDNDAAIVQLDAYLIEAPPAANVRDAQLLLAEALSADAQFLEAVGLFDVYIAGGGSVTPYAELDRAQALAWLGSPAAVGAADAALQGDLPRATRLQFIRAMAEILAQTRTPESLSWYERLEAESDDPADDAFAMWRAALIERDAGDQSALLELWPIIVSGYPDTSIAREALEDVPELVNVDAVIDPYFTALVHYYAGDAREARSGFVKSLTANRGGVNPAIAARASFYLGVLDERDGSYSSAIRRYAEAVELDPGVDLADDALWWEGRLHELRNDPDLARELYEVLSDDYGGSDYGKEASFRLALLLYDAQEWGDAADAFESVGSSSSGEDKLRAMVWHGKALEAGGDDEGASEVWRSVIDAASDEYYGLRAAVLLEGGEGSLRDADIDDEEVADWNAIETWLIGSGSGNPTAARLAFQASDHWRAGVELLAVGMEHRARIEFETVLESGLGDPNSLLLLSKEFQDIGQYGLSARAAARLLAHLPANVLVTAPEGLWKAAYPAPYAAAFDDAANEFDVPNVLLLALVRQESFFEPLAGSSAGAIGLTQVIGPTGEEIAEELEIEEFDTADLYQPVTSLRFGARYMAGQLDSFDGNMYHALAAYNGGPGNAQRWADLADGDVDRFVAEIEFDQTELYIKLVSENLARYRQIYEGLDGPALPKD